MKKGIVFIGGGDWALEIYNWLSGAIGYNDKWYFKGVLDTTPEVLGSLKKYYLGKEDDFIFCDDTLFVCTITNSSIKRKIVSKMKLRGANFFTLIHASSIIGTDVKLGEGNIVSPFVYIANDTTIGDFVGINVGSLIGHNVEIGDYTQINSNCDITGHVKIGQECFLGASVCIIPQIKIADKVNLGAGCVVIRHIKKEDSRYFGNPAREINFN